MINIPVMDYNATFKAGLPYSFFNIAGGWKALFSKYLVRAKARRYYKYRPEMSKVINPVIKRFMRILNEEMMKDLIYNNSIIELPYKKGYIFVSQVAKNSRHRKYYPEANTNRLRVMFIQGNNGLLIKHKTKATGRRHTTFLRYIRISRKWYLRMVDEAKNGHRYPTFEQVVELLKEYDHELNVRLS